MDVGNTLSKNNNSSESIESPLILLNACRAAKLSSEAIAIEQKFTIDHNHYGADVLDTYASCLTDLKKGVAFLLKTKSENISFIRNTAEGVNHIANAYDFRPGDEVIIFEHEYPSNFYPWILQQRRGVVIKQISARGGTGLWHMSDLEAAISQKTRIIAISHVQFTSGQTADLEYLGSLCRKRGIDLIVDGAQSVGCLPVYPEEVNISAIAASAWKWLMGPIGSAILYTTPELRNKLDYWAGGPTMVEQGSEYLNHNWLPFNDGRRFEYSSVPLSLACALERSITSTINHYGIESVYNLIIELQNEFLEQLDYRYISIVKPENNFRSSIIALKLNKDVTAVTNELRRHGIICTPRGGYLRIAPHIYNTDQELHYAAKTLNHIVVDKNLFS